MQPSPSLVPELCHFPPKETPCALRTRSPFPPVPDTPNLPCVSGFPCSGRFTSTESYRTGPLCLAAAVTWALEQGSHSREVRALPSEGLQTVEAVAFWSWAECGLQSPQLPFQGPCGRGSPTACPHVIVGKSGRRSPWPKRGGP